MSFVFDYLSHSKQRFFSPTEAALLLEVHPDTVRRWVDQKLIPSRITLGGHRRIPKEALITVGASCNYSQS